jgi:hypothetical protein
MEFDDEEVRDDNVFLLSWDCNGLEACIDLTDFEKAAMWNTLQNKDPNNKMNLTVNSILLRARMNPQRHYEVYTVRVDGGISEDDLIDMFKENPQGMADLVRARGVKIFSDRATSAPKIV